jgi:hypothetical protein
MDSTWVTSVMGVGVWLHTSLWTVVRTLCSKEERKAVGECRSSWSIDIATALLVGFL